MTAGPTSHKGSQVPPVQEPTPVTTLSTEPSKVSHEDELARQEPPRRILVTEAELHYKSLTDYFKYLVTLTLAAIGILVTVGLYVTYKDVSAMRAEVRQNVLDAKAEIRQTCLM